MNYGQLAAIDVCVNRAVCATVLMKDEATWKQSVTVCDKTWKQTLRVVFGIHIRFFVNEVQPTMK